MKGEIYLVDIPSNQGREQEGLRPVVLLSNINAGIVSVVPFTLNFHALKYSYTLKVESSKENGLRKDSVALIFQLRAIDMKKLKSKIGIIEQDMMRKFEFLIKKLFDLE
ncbi:hypothetical protein CMI41_00090 [Candidatus Pacearchaeota archaeon]|nr:hypothetical protein [Candidatus Pacearchaeota archaeon]|tara:strand:+ start:881 stop:1207 length:327 start_codon:yes stop_codon:yes gene_type:complete